MKRSQQCVKCKGRKLWVIEAFRLPGETGEGTALSLVPDQPVGGSRFGLSKAAPVGGFDLWLCAACGYSELWATGVSGLREDPARGVRLVDASITPEGPFR